MGGDTIFALSSGSPPAAIAVVRLSGPGAKGALEMLCGSCPDPRRIALKTVRDPLDGDILDRAVALFMPGPGSATGEDCAELHLHGGRAVVIAVEKALARLEGLRPAEAGEFTRRAFANGRMDLAEAEGLADLLTAETELQRRNAQALAGGRLSRHVETWRESILGLAAFVEANLDFSDEDDVAYLPPDFSERCGKLADELSLWLDAPRAEVLREGFRVVIAGPPNIGKSSLFNALIDEEAAIATPIAGTTRDILDRPVSISGIPFVYSDTAGLRDETDDPIEEIGIGKARGAVERADLVLWLGPSGQGPTGSWEVETKIDLLTGASARSARHRLSSVTGEGIDALRCDLVEHARQAMPKPGQLAVSRHQAALLMEAHNSILEASELADPLLIAESLRCARLAFDRLTGRAATEDMLDALFGRFCIGK